MEFKIILTPIAKEDYAILKNDLSKINIFKATLKILGYMRHNIRHPSLNTHKFKERKGPNNEEVFESYVQNNTPGAYRIFWFYGPKKKEITVLEITPHP